MLENILQTASFITSMLIMFCCIYNLATVLPMRGARVYFIASVVTVIVINLIPNVWPGINQVHFLLYGLVLPLVLMRAPMPQRLVGVALCLGLLYVGEFLLTIALSLVAGPMSFATAATTHTVLIFALRWVAVLLNLAGGRAIRTFMARWRWGERLGDVLPRFGLSVLLNAGFGIAFYYLTIVENLVANDPICIAGMALSILFAPIDAVLLVSLERARRVAAADARARVAEERLAACLARYDRVSRATVRTAQLRHDARAHLQAIAALVAEGDPARAEGYARETAALLRADDYGAFGLWDADEAVTAAASTVPHSDSLPVCPGTDSYSDKDGDTTCSSQASCW